MKNWTRYLWILLILHLFPLFSLGQPIVDGFDYPFGHKGYEGQNKVKYYEQYIYGYSTINNAIYPNNPCDYPRRESNGFTKFDGWYSLQDVGTYYENNGGLHSGEDWNHSSKDLKGNLYGDDKGLPVYSVASGEIFRIAPVSSSSSLGSYIIIKHKFANNAVVYSIYAHIEINPEIKSGIFINRGVLLGKIADISAPHLHFEMRTDIKFKESLYFWDNSANRGWYYTDSKTSKRYSPLTKSQTEKAFNFMKEDGIIDPSDFIDSHRSSIGVGYYSENDWRNDGISLAFLNCYNKNGGTDSIGDPFDNNGGGRFIHLLSSYYLNQSMDIYIQDFINSKGEITTICYNPELKKAFHLKGCIGFLWWEKSNPQNIASLAYQNYLGLPTSDEEIIEDGDFTKKQVFKYGTIFWKPNCLDGKDNVKIEFSSFLQNNGCLSCQPQTNLSVCRCNLITTLKSTAILPDCDQLFSTHYLQKTSWDFGNEETNGWTGRNAKDLGFGENWYWIVDPIKDPDPISESGIVSPPFLSSVNTDTYNQVEIRFGCKSQFIKNAQIHLLIGGEWKPPVVMNCISPPEIQLPNSQCIYSGIIPYPGQIQQFRIDFIEGSDLIDDQLFVDYVKFIEGSNPVPTLVASFSSNVQYGKFPFTVKFTDTSLTKSVTSPLSYEWDFGDGSKSSEQSPTHLYTKPGEYSVSLTIASDIYRNTFVQYNYIHTFESSPVTNLEYFFDDDPGQGKGVSVNSLPSENFNQSFDLNYCDIAEGYHTLFIRAKDGSGKWGTVASKPFFHITGLNLSNISQVEYYIDDDPGQGKATLESVNPSIMLEHNIFLDLNSLNQGNHILGVRVINGYSNWSDTYIQHFAYKSAPIANAGLDQSVNEGAIVSLDGSASSDPDGDPLTYKWTAPTGITLSSTTVTKPTFTVSEVSSTANYTFSLVVNDGTVDSPMDQVIITVQNVNKAPLANAGIDQSVNEGAIVSLDGSASSDPDGDPLTYKWTAPTGITLSSTTLVNPTFATSEVYNDSTLNFSLVVNDGVINSLPATVKVTVLNMTNVGFVALESPLFKIFPNPTTGIINLELSEGKEKKTEIVVTNLAGAEIFRRQEDDTGKFQIDLSSQANGIYLLKVTIGNKQSINKVIVRKE